MGTKRLSLGTKRLGTKRPWVRNDWIHVGSGNEIESNDAILDLHRGQTSEQAREIARGSHRSIRKTLRVAVTAASSCELEAKFSFYFNEVHRR